MKISGDKEKVEQGLEGQKHQREVWPHRPAEKVT